MAPLEMSSVIGGGGGWQAVQEMYPHSWTRADRFKTPAMKIVLCPPRISSISLSDSGLERKIGLLFVHVLPNMLQVNPICRQHHQCCFLGQESGTLNRTTLS